MWLDDFLALGWALKTTAFPAATMARPLPMAVEVGFVLGMMAPMTPKARTRPG